MKYEIPQIKQVAVINWDNFKNCPKTYIPSILVLQFENIQFESKLLNFGPILTETDY